MRKPHLVSLILGTAVIAAGAPSVAFAQPLVGDHAATATKPVSARTLLMHLLVKKETHGSTYARSKFTAWIDADHDGEDTRAEVLKAESIKNVTINTNGTVKTGKWVSRYDGVTVTVASKLDIDHLVPLEEAWVSGASQWSALKREAYANDIGYAADLVAVTAHANRSKGDREPNGYLPPRTSYRCTYVKNYIAVKTRWHLSVNTSEKRSLSRDLSKYCKNLTVKKAAAPKISTLTGRRSTPGQTSTPVPSATTPTPSTTPTSIATVPTPSITPTPIATVPTATSTPVPVGTPTPSPVATSTPAPVPTVTSTSAPSAYYSNCDSVRAAGKAPLYRGQPGYRSGLDRDGDGIACETA